ncbi:MAG: bifunctional 4-hydroxy-2-oxoglutarate aldolase/2-dehydro-3-deoxy-phosphogluconate aldolase [Candidatus Marinimicrobia bacterium]|nr:bifunctional 4-hydroxy-2-oxoglutarate aldolase/2-dehydro-3-deoxy-phosphogluconate aldolase [Candidatus Neomarinimicrobiota bacterium]
MNKQDVLNKIMSVGIVPVVRIADGGQVLDAADALIAGGINIMEVTMSSTRPFEIIQNLKARYGDKLLVGLGSVLNEKVAEKGIDAGAQFIVSPIFDDSILKAAQKHEIASILGSLTPTEIQRSFSAGTDVVKVFPATKFGPGYFKDILAPMPHLKLTPTGGVDLSNVAEFLRNGAVCVGVGSALLKNDLIANSKWEDLTDLARQYCAEVEKGRT